MSDALLRETAEQALPPRRRVRLPAVPVIGVPVTALSFKDHVNRICRWATRERAGRVVCVANVHMLVEARRHRRFHALLRRADMVTPDGMPLVWVMRASRARRQRRVAGMDLLPALCAAAERRSIPVYFLGSTPEVLSRIRDRLRQEHPRLVVVGMESPPFRPLSEDEDDALVQRINSSGARILFVSLGCPKQERWMTSHRTRVDAVMVGVGAAFPVYAGAERRAPRWMRYLGLEWAFRLVREPGRLWRRYLVTNFLFGYYVATERFSRRAERTR